VNEARVPDGPPRCQLVSSAAAALPLAMAATLLLPATGAALEIDLGGDSRYYQFLRIEDDDASRRDAELGVLRLKLQAREGEEWIADVHGVVSLTSPAATGASAIVTGSTPRLLDLEATVVRGEDVEVVMELDRLSLTWQRREFRLVVGRQAITWGVNFFWPVLDLFAPFAPERIDREYKPGVDAVRLTVPLGPLSEVEAVAAGQGESIEDDGSVAALVRLHAGPADVGAMGGRFHRDLVVGAFVTASVRGTGLRAEVAFTESGDPDDAAIGRSSFWRASAGLDRQLTPSLTLTAEAYWNGFGAEDPSGYRRVAAADRVQRGEVTSLGQYYAGLSLAWQAHPLVSVTGTVLVNLGDPSALLLPYLDWSLADNLSLLLGALVGLGPGLDRAGTPGSEYGAVPATFYVALRAYF
jgi:hypothetical protein